MDAIWERWTPDVGPTDDGRFDLCLRSPSMHLPASRVWKTQW